MISPNNGANEVATHQKPYATKGSDGPGGCTQGEVSEEEIDTKVEEKDFKYVCPQIVYRSNGKMCQSLQEFVQGVEEQIHSIGYQLLYRGEWRKQQKDDGSIHDDGYQRQYQEIAEQEVGRETVEVEDDQGSSTYLCCYRDR